MTDHLPQVGAPDPERRTSPIFDDVEEIPVDFVMESDACYFNDVAYPVDQHVLSGSELLHCEGGGVWVRRGEIPPRLP